MANDRERRNADIEQEDLGRSGEEDLSGRAKDEDEEFDDVDESNDDLENEDEDDLTRSDR
jgi:hypothetical protein